ncbi:iron-containing alcohol dehydrogenase [Escherichia coli]|uniref:Iron-containing alcohol dehydrogenase n=1 Tax=Escherichia coli TaxID=562 RepID=A0A484YD40_ECOLX|nr:iron-containing alcohol dehydrogenase [Escherichia coli]
MLFNKPYGLRHRYAFFGEVTPDPDIDILTSGAARFKAFKPDVIIALGGGSSLDAAKGIKVTLEEYLEIIKSISLLFPQPADPALK